MCGIVGCVGHEGAVDFAIKGLGDLEYRGYDSMGIAFPTPELPRRLEVYKSLGGVSGLNAELQPSDHSASTAIGHTRWATHGGVTIPNTHPHLNETATIGVVHNGVIENHGELRKDLRYNGYKFVSQTDTEVVPHLIDYYLKEGQEPDEAFRSAISRLRGAYAILACLAQEPNAVYAAKLGSPL